MVRTLDFHSKNAGSNPASLKIVHSNLSPIIFFKKPNQLLRVSRSIKYSYTFTSLISPFSNKNSTLLNGRSSASKKISVKQSYILVTWISYFLNNQRLDISGACSTDALPSALPSKPYKILSLFVKPTRVYKSTILKAPMAHKTFSQEQLMFRVYKLSISFSFPNSFYAVTPNINQTLFIFLGLRSSPWYFGTNLFFLQKIRLCLLSKDNGFFSKLL